MRVALVEILAVELMSYKTIEEEKRLCSSHVVSVMFKTRFGISRGLKLTGSRPSRYLNPASSAATAVA